MNIKKLLIAAAAIAALLLLCDAHGAQLIVVFSPASAEQLTACSSEMLEAYFSAVEAETECWNFCISPLSFDERYFYDTAHSRSSVGGMMLVQMFGDDSVWYPAHFGYSVGRPTAAELLSSTQPEAALPLPVLLYHHLADGEQRDTVISPAAFRHHIELLHENGFSPVSLHDIAAYVEHGTPLPEKPVVITFDDGYYSNYELAYPILKEYNDPAVIFVIGCSFGHMEYYKDTNHTLTPHFGAQEAREMADSGLIELQSHTYDLHQHAPFETGDRIRIDLRPLDDDTEESYIRTLRADAQQERALLSEFGEVFSAAYPRGASVPLTRAVLAQEGVRMTFTTDPTHRNELLKGLPCSLMGLGRKSLCDAVSDEELLSYLHLFY